MIHTHTRSLLITHFILVMVFSTAKAHIRTSIQLSVYMYVYLHGDCQTFQHSPWPHSLLPLCVSLSNFVTSSGLPGATGDHCLSYLCSSSIKLPSVYPSRYTPFTSRPTTQLKRRVSSQTYSPLEVTRTEGLHTYYQLYVRIYAPCCPRAVRTVMHTPGNEPARSGNERAQHGAGVGS